MLFSSITFLYAFLPLALMSNYIAPYKWRNTILLFFSLIFYAWGSVSYSLLLLLSIIINYGFGLLVAGAQKKCLQNKRAALAWLVTGVSLNIGILVIFKYTGFFMHNINKVLALGGFDALHIPSILLPVGISFFTFQGLSYLVDVFRGTSKAQRNFINLSLFISMFPQLIAGPIVRYHDVDQQLQQRFSRRRKFAQGVERFLLGLAKKVILANTFAAIADASFASDPTALSTQQAWAGIIFYGLQIYYDFSGYSDMAIGLGRMLGFHFLENFNFPYIATSIREFWQRWHISLSNWFRDYLYIPLGGNKKGPYRTYFNLFVVFLLTGLWHGAGMNFIFWGLIHGFFMITERLGTSKILKRLPRIVSNIYVILIVLLAWVPFRGETLQYSLDYIKQMFVFTGESSVNFGIHYTPTTWVWFATGIAGAFGIFPYLWKHIVRWYRHMNKSKKTTFTFAYDSLSIVFYACILIISTTLLLSGSYNPFIYFRF